MILRSAYLKNFRNIGEQRFSFLPGLNIIYGKNAQGKTNAIEGIYLFAGGRSFRHAKDREMISYGKSVSELEIAYGDVTRENIMSVILNSEKRRSCSKNGIKIPKMSEFIGNFRAVLFCPENIDVVKDEPSVRRFFLDSAISQLKPSYIASLSDYKKLLEQRNILLKNYDECESVFEASNAVLTESMSRLSGYITAVRDAYIKKLSVYVSSYMEDMTSGLENVSVLYKSGIDPGAGNDLSDADANTAGYIKKMKENLRREIAAGITLTGIHRDDFDININGNSARIFASQGQQRSIALALILGEGEIAREQTGEYPVFLFDDVLSELDRERKNYILGRLSGRQVIVTTCDESDFSDAVDAKKIYTEKGIYY